MAYHQSGTTPRKTYKEALRVVSVISVIGLLVPYLLLPRPSLATNNAPTIFVSGPGTIIANCGDLVSFYVLANDPDGNIVTLTNIPTQPAYVATPPAVFTITDSPSANPSGSFQWTPEVTGNFIVNFRVTDPGGLFASALRLIEVINCPPVINSITGTGDTVVNNIDATNYATTIYRDQLLSFSVHATDPIAADTVTFNGPAISAPNGEFKEDPAINPTAQAHQWNSIDGNPATGTFTWQPCKATVADNFNDCLTQPTPPGYPITPFDISFTAQDSLGATSAPVTVHVVVLNQYPVAVAAVTPKASGALYCVGENAQFNLTNSDDADMVHPKEASLSRIIQAWSWTFGDGSAPESNFPNGFRHLYTIAGHHDISLDVQDYNGAWNLPPSSVVGIDIAAPPTIDSVATSSGTITPGPIDPTTNKPSSYNVELFRDQPLQLTAVGSDPQNQPLTLHSTFAALPPGKNGVAGTFTPTTGSLNWQPCLGSVPAAYPILDQNSFQDCLTLKTNALDDPNFIPQDHPFTVQFWATTDACMTDAVVKKVTVNVTVKNRPPVAKVAITTPGPYCVGKNILFNLTNSDDADMVHPKGALPRIVRAWDWNFGDGPNQRGDGYLLTGFLSFNHTYTTGGHKTVTLDVRDWNGTWDENSSTVGLDVFTPHSYIAPGFGLNQGNNKISYTLGDIRGANFNFKSTPDFTMSEVGVAPTNFKLTFDDSLGLPSSIHTAIASSFVPTLVVGTASFNTLSLDTLFNSVFAPADPSGKTKDLTVTMQFSLNSPRACDMVSISYLITVKKK